VFFESSMTKAKEVFGKYAFRKIKHGDKRRNTVNRSLLETFGCALENYDLQVLKNAKEKIVNNFKEELSKDSFFEACISVATNNIDRVHYRFAKVEEIVKKAIEG
jgi:hypothetical protein